MLVTGLGITAKSTFRELIGEQLQAKHDKVVCLDLDYERDKLPEEFELRTIYILEDVHGPTPQAVIPLKDYDKIYYLEPNWLTHLRFWLSRMRIWFKTGQFAWDADKGEQGQWQGTGKPYDPTNIMPIIKEFWQHFKNRGKTIEDDLRVIRKTGIDCAIIHPRITKQGIRFYTYDLDL